MTIISFQFTDGYHTPAKGSVVFMPTRKHAANETTVLPKPFTKKLIHGSMEVDLEPTGDNWAWAVTHNQETRYYTIPDHEGVIPHTDLIPVAPSTLEHQIEPVWWSELRQLQNLTTGYIEESVSNAREAIDTVNSVHNTLKTAVSDAQRHESVAGAYARQSQSAAAETWEASKKPGGYADQAREARDQTRIYRDTANQHRQDASNSATTAELEADRSTTQAERSHAEANRSEQEADRATTQANTAENEANRAEQEADRAESARDEATTGPNNAADRAESAATRSEAAATESQTSADESSNSAISAASSESAAQTHAETAQLEANRAETAANTVDIGEWNTIEPLNGWTIATGATARWRVTHGLIHIIGRFNGTESTGTTVAELPVAARYAQYFLVENGTDTPSRIVFNTNGQLNLLGTEHNYSRISVNEFLEYTEP